jgi:hypothetical protein
MCLFISCADINQMDNTGSYIVETTVTLQEGKTNKVLALFKSTPPN